MDRTADPGAVSLQVGSHRAQVHDPPTTTTLPTVILRTPAMAFSTPIALRLLRANRRDDRVLNRFELDVLDHGLLDTE